MEQVEQEQMEQGQEKQEQMEQLVVRRLGPGLALFFSLLDFCQNRVLDILHPVLVRRNRKGM